MSRRRHPNAPPEGAAWIWESKEMLTSDAWRVLTPAALRLLQFLKIEFMRHAGRANGSLKAPRRQLERFGIGTHQITAAIALLERTGIVDCARAGRRVPLAFTLTWLPLPDGTPASNRWRGFKGRASRCSIGAQG